MKDEFLVISTSLNPQSKSRILAKEAYGLLNGKGGASFVDLQDYALPFCDGGSCYSHPQVIELKEKIEKARCLLVAVPVYNYDANAAAKNLIELTGSSWNNKIVGFLCAAGGRSSYMSIMGLANSLMLDFRCLIIPRFVYADGQAFSEAAINDTDLLVRINELVTSALNLNQGLSSVMTVI